MNALVDSNSTPEILNPTESHVSFQEFEMLTTKHSQIYRVNLPTKVERNVLLEYKESFNNNLFSFARFLSTEQTEQITSINDSVASFFPIEQTEQTTPNNRGDNVTVTNPESASISTSLILIICGGVLTAVVVISLVIVIIVKKPRWLNCRHFYSRISTTFN
jgi:hypothetical protein